MSDRSAPTPSCRGCARGSPTRSRDRTSDRACTTRASVAREAPARPASRWPAAPRSTADVDARRRALRARRRRRHRPARDRPDRAARLDHQLRAELPGRRRVLRRGLPLALHARRAGRHAAAAAAVDHARRARGGTSSREGRNVGRPAAAVHRGGRRRRASRRPTSCGRGRTCTSTAASPPATTEFVVAPTWARCCRGSQATLGANPDLAYSRLVCPRRLDAEHRATTRSSCRRSRPGGSPAWGSTRRRRAARHRSRPGAPTPDQPEPAQPARTTTAGTSAPATEGDFEYLVRLLEPQPVDARVGARDMDVAATRARTCPASTTRTLGGVLRLGGALRVPRASLSAERAARRSSATRTGTQPYPHPFQTALAAFVNLADDYAAQTAADANADAGLPPDVDGDPDPLITPPLYGRWHALTQRLLTRARRRRRSTPTTTGCTSSTSIRATGSPPGFGTQRRAGRTRRTTWTPPGSRSATCSRPTGGSARRSWRSRSPALLAHRAPAAAGRRAAGARCSRSPRRCTRRVRRRRTRPCATARATSLVPPALTSAAMRRDRAAARPARARLPFGARCAPEHAARARQRRRGQRRAAEGRAARRCRRSTTSPTRCCRRACRRMPCDLLRRCRGCRCALALVLARRPGAARARPARRWSASRVAVGAGRLWLAAARWAARSRAPSRCARSADRRGGRRAAAEPGLHVAEPGGDVDRRRPAPTDSAEARALQGRRCATGTRCSARAASAAADARAGARSTSTAVAATTVGAHRPGRARSRRGRSPASTLPAAHRRRSWSTSFGEVMAYPEIDLPMYEPLKRPLRPSCSCPTST